MKSLKQNVLRAMSNHNFTLPTHGDSIDYMSVYSDERIHPGQLEFEFCKDLVDPDEMYMNLCYAKNSPEAQFKEYLTHLQTFWHEND